MPEEIGVHIAPLSPPAHYAKHPHLLLTILSRTDVLSIVGDALGRVQYPERPAFYSILSNLLSEEPMPVDTRTVDPLRLGQRIAALRRAHNWSQRRLAEVAG